MQEPPGALRSRGTHALTAAATAGFTRNQPRTRTTAFDIIVVKGEEYSGGAYISVC